MSSITRLSGGKSSRGRCNNFVKLRERGGPTFLRSITNDWSRCGGVKVVKLDSFGDSVFDKLENFLFNLRPSKRSVFLSEMSQRKSAAGEIWNKSAKPAGHVHKSANFRSI